MTEYVVWCSLLMHGLRFMLTAALHLLSAMCVAAVKQQFIRCWLCIKRMQPASLFPFEGFLLKLVYCPVVFKRTCQCEQCCGRKDWMGFRQTSALTTYLFSSFQSKAPLYRCSSPVKCHWNKPLKDHFFFKTQTSFKLLPAAFPFWGSAGHSLSTLCTQCFDRTHLVFDSCHSNICLIADTY